MPFQNGKLKEKQVEDNGLKQVLKPTVAVETMVVDHYLALVRERGMEACFNTATASLRFGVDFLPPVPNGRQFMQVHMHCISLLHS